MSTLQRIEAISKELSEMADKEDYLFIYGELLHRITSDITRHGLQEREAQIAIARLVDVEEGEDPADSDDWDDDDSEVYSTDDDELRDEIKQLVERVNALESANK